MTAVPTSLSVASLTFESHGERHANGYFVSSGFGASHDRWIAPWASRNTPNTIRSISVSSPDGRSGTMVPLVRRA